MAPASLERTTSLPGSMDVILLLSQTISQILSISSWESSGTHAASAPSAIPATMSDMICSLVILTLLPSPILVT